MKVALLQFCAGENKTANLKQAAGMAKQALTKGAKFVLLPEVFNYRSGGKNKDLFIQAAEDIPGPSTSVFMALARQYKAFFVLGSMLEKTIGPRAYNTSVFINPSGQITAKYRKIHLFDARIGGHIIREGDVLLAGRELKTAKAGEFSVGLSICYDLRFPGLYQNYARRGVEILTVPSCFTKETGKAHWEVLLRARAIENLSYVLACNQVGITASGLQAYGQSMIVSPWGKVIARGSLKGQEIVYGEINMEEVRKARQILPGIAL
jgi:deaminated glutathione amidase